MGSLHQKHRLISHIYLQYLPPTPTVKKLSENLKLCSPEVLPTRKKVPFFIQNSHCNLYQRDSARYRSRSWKLELRTFGEHLSGRKLLHGKKLARYHTCIIGHSLYTCISPTLPEAWLPRLQTSNFAYARGRRHSPVLPTLKTGNSAPW